MASGGVPIALREAKRRNRLLLSCTECHRRKQKCNRALPCNDCIERKVPYKCIFVSLDQAQESSPQQSRYRPRKPISSATTVHEFTEESVVDLGHLHPQPVQLGYASSNRGGLDPYQSKLLDDARASIVGLSKRPILDPPASGRMNRLTDLYSRFGKPDAFDPFSSLPHTTHWAPALQQPLIHYFIHKLVPWLSAYEEDLNPTLPGFSWLPESISHPALFHGTLLSAAVHLDRIQPSANPEVAIWLKAETLKLLNHSLSSSSEGASDQNIITVLILLYFNVTGGDPTEYETHLNGIHQMIKIRGGISKLGLRGMIKNWLAICHGPWSPGWEYGHFLLEARPVG